MRHHNKKRTLHRDKRQRTALLRSLTRSLIEHEAIVTSVAKAKELRPVVEKLVTASKSNTVASHRYVSEHLVSKTGVKKLHEVLAPRYSKRSGGYTRIVRLGRVGKRVQEVARIEFVQ